MFQQGQQKPEPNYVFDSAMVYELYWLINEEIQIIEKEYFISTSGRF